MVHLKFSTLQMMVWIVHVFLLVSVFVVQVEGDDLPTCLAKDFHFEYTECDSEGGRWRVSVPKPGICTGGVPNAPVRGKGCTFTCKEGQYLEINGTQECQDCPAGTYSMGGGVRFEDWDTLPEGFSIQTENFMRHIRGLWDKEGANTQEPDTTNCSRSAWQPQGHHMYVNPEECVSTMVYSAKLVRAGSVTFKYQYPDDKIIFHFKVQNDQCEAVDDKGAAEVALTEPGRWNEITVDLKSGLNILHWKAFSLSLEGDSEGGLKVQHAVLIKEIEITGVAYTSTCSKCRAGSSSTVGSSACTLCPKNSFAQRGASSCQQCDLQSEYSEKGAKECKKRPACTTSDYFDYQSPCDTSNQTQKLYKWIEPKICRDDLPNSVKLPQAGPKVTCPPCNPGMEFRNGGCHFCPTNEYSNGSLPCRPCPSNTAPVTGVQIKWWNNLPNDVNFTTSCLSSYDDGCASKDGWQFSTDNVHSGRGHTDDVYVVLMMKIAGGFQGRESFIDRNPQPVANISFVFEMNCKRDCELFVMQTTPRGGTTVVKKWKGMQEKQLYSVAIKWTGETTFSWAFQKTSSDLSRQESAELVNDEARIFSINVTNTRHGGASACRMCPMGALQAECIPCPDGHYISRNTTQCMPCPKDSIARQYDPWGIEACHPCGEGLAPNKDQTRCETKCRFKTAEGQEFDFTQLRGFHSVQGSRLFTSSGTEYFHNFNVSLCARTEDELATCKDNITTDVKDMPTEIVVKSAVCRSTIVPPKANEKKVMSAQPSSLGDILVNVTTNGSSLNMAERLKKTGFMHDVEDIDVHFTYLSETPTHACPNGRTTILTLRCDVQEKGNGSLHLPPNCMDGTCDGCTFHLLWRARQACPVCRDDQYKMVKGECVHGVQVITYIPPQHCILLNGRAPTEKKQACPRWPPLWVLITIGCVIVTGTIMCFLLIWCWCKNRNLEYKYMKLVEGAKEGELPAAESCAVDEGEEDEFDAVRFQESKGRKFFNRIRSIGNKKGNNPFETIQLTDSMDKA